MSKPFGVAGESHSSPIYQVLLSKIDISIFENPKGQPAQDPMNCGSVSLYLLRLLDKQQAEYNAPRTEGLHISEIVEYINNKHEYKIAFTEDARNINFFGLMYFKTFLFEGFATIVLATRKAHAVGHYFVFYKNGGELYALDAQTRKGYGGIEAIQAYLEGEGLNDMFVFVSGPSGDKNYYTGLYIDTLSDILASGCAIVNANEGGGKRRKHPKRKTRKHKTQKKRKTYRR